jgi:hypothetical protein
MAILILEEFVKYLQKNCILVEKLYQDLIFT